MRQEEILFWIIYVTIGFVWITSIRIRHHEKLPLFFWALFGFMWPLILIGAFLQFIAETEL